MKILWIVNTIFPYPAEKLGYNKSVFGGWMLGLMNKLIENDDIELAIATTYSGIELKKYIDHRVVYYLLPCKNNYKYDSNLEHYWIDINDDFKPDIVHLHGTEFAHGLAFLNVCPHVKSVVSIQGLVSLYGDAYLHGIDKSDIIKNITFRDIIKGDNLYQAQRKFLKRGETEIKILQLADRIIGRTSWDYAGTMQFTDVSKYCKCNENLRDVFYNSRWDYSKIEKHTIFVSQASYPIKGFHEVIKALATIKKYYSDVKVYVAGLNITDVSSLNKKIKLNGYAKFLIKQMKKYEVMDNIVFLGLLNEEDMVSRLLKSNVFVQASILENSPNSLGEAMLIGMPIVASNVGGTSDMLVDKKEGYLYPYGETNLLAKYIVDVFDAGDKAIELGNNARSHALKTHNRQKNANDMINIYRSITNEIKK